MRLSLFVIFGVLFPFKDPLCQYIANPIRQLFTLCFAHLEPQQLTTSQYLHFIDLVHNTHTRNQFIQQHFMFIFKIWNKILNLNRTDLKNTPFHKCRISGVRSPICFKDNMIIKRLQVCFNFYSTDFDFVLKSAKYFEYKLDSFTYQ